MHTNMAIKTRRTKITIERHDITILRNRGDQDVVFCEQCQSTVPARTKKETARLFHVSTETIAQLLDTAEIHLVRTNDDQPLICGGRSSGQNNY
jgi:hypothetical protein